jgi:hypothetical protein
VLFGIPHARRHALETTSGCGCQRDLLVMAPVAAAVPANSAGMTRTPRMAAEVATRTGPEGRMMPEAMVFLPGMVNCKAGCITTAKKRIAVGSIAKSWIVTPKAAIKAGSVTSGQRAKYTPQEQN